MRSWVEEIDAEIADLEQRMYEADTAELDGRLVNRGQLLAAQLRRRWRVAQLLRRREMEEMLRDDV